MDLIENYPSVGTAFIGFFAVDASLSGRGIGTRIIAGCLKTFFEQGFKKARLAVDYGNCQSKAFWTENGFTFTGEEYPNGFSSYLVMEKVNNLDILWHKGHTRKKVVATVKHRERVYK